jgi:hypothetical protein
VNLTYDFSLKTGLFISRNRNWNPTDKKLLGATKGERRKELGNEHEQNLVTEQNCDSVADNISVR